MRIFTTQSILATCLIIGTSISSFAQTPVNGFMQGKNGGGITFSGTHEHYKAAYLVPVLLEPIPIYNQVTVNSFSIYGNYGVTDKLDLIVNVPFVQTIGSGNPEVLSGLGFTNQREGAQDLTAFAKYEFAKFGSISLQGAAGITTPLSNYAVEPSLNSIISIGNQATTYNGILVGHFMDSRGFFITGQAGYSFRTTEVPDAVLSELKIGFAANRFYIAGQVGNQTSTGGVDILRQGFTGSFPATKVNYTRVGGTIYTPLDENLGLSISGGGIVDGRNVAKSYYGSVGVTYNFIARPITK